MRELTVGNGHERQCLKINIGEQSYMIPLAKSLTMREAAGLETAEGTVTFISNYIPAEVIDTLTVSDFDLIIETWKSESNLGES